MDDLTCRETQNLAYPSPTSFLSFLFPFFVSHSFLSIRFLQARRDKTGQQRNAEEAFSFSVSSTSLHISISTLPQATTHFLLLNSLSFINVLFQTQTPTLFSQISSAQLSSTIYLCSILPDLGTLLFQLPKLSKASPFDLELSWHQSPNQLYVFYF